MLLLMAAALATAVSSPVPSFAPSPTGLLVDAKPPPAVGVSAQPSFAWVVPHLPRQPGCSSPKSNTAEDGDETDQVQHSYQLQVVDQASTTVVHDSGRLLTPQSANVDLVAAVPLEAGTAYTWRVRVWTSAHRGDSCASGWASGRFTTALFNGFAAQPIWLASAAATPAPVVPLPAAVDADTDCDLSGMWKGNGCGGGCPISITKAKSQANGAQVYDVNAMVLADAWQSTLTDFGNGTLVLAHGGGRIARKLQFNRSSSLCTQIKFDNGDDWCKADVCGAAHPGRAPPAPPPSGDKGSTYAYFRHKETLRGDVASASVFVSANQDGSLKKLLSAYRLYVNGKVVSVGPGRGNSANAAPNHTVYDSVDITAELQQAWAARGSASSSNGDGGAATVTFAAQCYHHDSGADAKFMLQAQITYAASPAAAQGIHTIVSDSSWLGYDATKIYNPTGGMGGDVSRSSSDNQPAEYIDASLVLSGWQGSAYQPTTAAGWKPVAPRSWVVAPQPKVTLPIAFLPGFKPVEMTELSPGHWFVDFGTEIMAGLTLKVSGGHAGTKLRVRMSEELMCTGCNPSGPAGHGGPNAGKGCNTCDFNQTHKQLLYPMRTGNTYEEVWTLGSGVSEIENHEYKLFRWAEINVTETMGERAESLAGMTLDLSAWVVRYPWSEADAEVGSFNSSNPMLNKVWGLMLNTVKVTSLDTTTDSNTREKLPYEADGYITGGTRHSMQRDSTWQRHSSLHNIRNPTWPTEWRQIMSLMAYEDYMATGSAAIAEQLYDTILENTQIGCLNKQTQLVDYTSCPRQGGGGKVRDITDWPMDARDGYQMTDIGNVINAYFVACMKAMAVLASAMGKTEDADNFANQAKATTAAMQKHMIDPATGLFTDTVVSTPSTSGGLHSDSDSDPEAALHSAWHSQIFSMWAGVATPEAFPKLIAYLRKKSVNTGVTGSVYAAYAYFLALYEADSDHGNFALEALTSCDNNSYCHMLLQGATATMEAWTRPEKDNLSWSHPWASAAGTAIPRGFMGITATSPGFKTFKVKPQPGSVAEAQMSLPTHAGAIKAAFVHSKTAFTLTLSPPANTKAKVCLPKLGLSSTSLTVDGRAMQGAVQGDYVCVDGVGSAAKPRVISRP